MIRQASLALARLKDVLSKIVGEIRKTKQTSLKNEGIQSYTRRQAFILSLRCVLLKTLTSFQSRTQLKKSFDTIAESVQTICSCFHYVGDEEIVF